MIKDCGWNINQLYQLQFIYCFYFHQGRQGKGGKKDLSSEWYAPAGLGQMLEKGGGFSVRIFSKGLVYIVRIVPLQWGGPPPKIQAWSHAINFFHWFMHMFNPSSMLISAQIGHLFFAQWPSRWLCSTFALRCHGGEARREDLCRLLFAKVLYM